MKITIFTSNQPRHLALINRLASVSTTTYAIIECNTVFPGLLQDFYKKSDTMREYFSHVIRAEKKLFGDLCFLPPNVKSLAIKSGDLNFLEKNQLQDALQSNIYIVFGASYIKGWLVDFLVENRTLNIHMGVSPYYRGSSCNFWALYDGNPHHVGSTIHLLSKGLDSGPMLYHALPRFNNDSPFEFTMRAVVAAQQSLVEHIASRELQNFKPQIQDKNLEIRYTKNVDFTDAVAADFLSRSINTASLEKLLLQSSPPKFLHPFFA